MLHHNTRPKRAFTLIELLATISIITVLVVMSVQFIANYLTTAKRSSDKQTLTVLNAALDRYKTEGGIVAALTASAPLDHILTRLKTPTSWVGVTHQFLNNNYIAIAASIAATGDGKYYRFTRYNSYTAESGTTTTNTSTPAAPTIDYSYADGKLFYERWNNVGGGIYVSGLTSDARYIANAPSYCSAITSGAVPENIGDSYGTRVTGYIIPPYTGNYIFTLNSDDDSALFVSTDHTANNLAQVINLTYYTSGYSASSAPIALQANQRYYIKGLFKEAGGGDYCRIGWQFQGSPTFSQSTISSAYITSALAAPAAGSPPASTANGLLNGKHWDGISGGNDVTNLTSNINYPNNPTSTFTRSQFSIPENVGDSYGAVLEGYIYPPADGNYIFTLNSDDHSDLYLSTDSTDTNLTKIASVSYPVNGYYTESAPIPLQKNHKYRARVIFKESSSSDYCRVGWRHIAIDGFSESIISSSYISNN